MSFASVADLRAAAGTVLGHSGWLTVGQDRVDLFAEATDDRQWIHVDPVRAAAGPFRGTVAHGFLTLSLIPFFVRGHLAVGGIRMAVNYGLNRVRFPAAVPVGSRIRGLVELVAVSDVPGGVEVLFRVTVECEAAEKPACVAELVARLYT